jgi:hypothetical protein
VRGGALATRTHLSWFAARGGWACLAVVYRHATVTVPDAMKLILDILQGAGLAAAVGIRPFLPALAAGALAAGDVGVDFDGTDYAFLEAPGFLLALAVGLAVSVVIARRIEEDDTTAAAMAGIGLGLGALLYAGTLADHGYASWPGLIGGLACAALAQAAARDLFMRVRARLDPDARAALPVYFEGAGLALVALSVLVPPVSIVALGFLVWLLAGGRRREGAKYAGLRILR